jgi:hypothetical protein
MQDDNFATVQAPCQIDAVVSWENADLTVSEGCERYLRPGWSVIQSMSLHILAKNQGRCRPLFGFGMAIAI